MVALQVVSFVKPFTWISFESRFAPSAAFFKADGGLREENTSSPWIPMTWIGPGPWKSLGRILGEERREG